MPSEEHSQSSVENTTIDTSTCGEAGPSTEVNPSQSPLRKATAKLIRLKGFRWKQPRGDDEGEEESEEFLTRAVKFATMVEQYSISECSRSIISELRIRQETHHIRLMEPDAHPAEAKKYLKRMEKAFYYLIPCIGIGGVWRFPYLCYVHRGGAFLIPYLLMILICGLPAFHLETVVAQFTSGGFIKVFDASPIMKGTGYATLVLNIFLCAYTSIIGTYSLFFTYFPLHQHIDWNVCNYYWNDGNCTQLGSGSVASSPETPPEQFLTRFALRTSKSIDNPGGLVWEMISFHILMYSVILVCCSLGWKNIRTSFYALMPLGYLAMIIMLLRAVTLPGALRGMRAYVVPQMEEFLSIKTWVDAAVQALFTVGAGLGMAIHRARFNYVNHNCWWEVFCVPALSTVVSIIFGLVLFCGLGYLHVETGIPVFSLAKDGPAVMFSIYPAMIAKIPVPQLWNVFIFFSIFLVTIAWIVIQLDASQWSLYDVYPDEKNSRMPRIIAVTFFLFMGSAFCLQRNGIYWIKLLDTYAPLTIVLICLMEILACVWIYGMKNYARVLKFVHSARTVNGLWWLCWIFLTPATLVCVLCSFVACDKRLSYGTELFPSWTVISGWIIALASAGFIPVYATFKVLTTKGTLTERLRNLICTSTQFAPENEADAESWSAFCSLYSPSIGLSGWISSCFSRHSHDVDIEGGEEVA